MTRHRGAFEYDWRSRFGLPLTVVGDAMSWGEAVRLTQLLEQDPSSMVCAALADLDHPFTREWLVLADMWDALAHQVYKAPKPYRRPFRDPTATRRGRTTLSRVEVVAILNSHGHEIGD